MKKVCFFILAVLCFSAFAQQDVIPNAPGIIMHSSSVLPEVSKEHISTSTGDTSTQRMSGGKFRSEKKTSAQSNSPFCNDPGKKFPLKNSSPLTEDIITAQKIKRPLNSGNSNSNEKGSPDQVLAPGNDNCASATDLGTVSTTTTVAGTCVSATADLWIPSCWPNTYKNVWYKFTVPAGGGTYTMSVVGPSSMGPEAAIISMPVSCNLTGAIQIACGGYFDFTGSSTTVNLSTSCLVAGTYYIVVDYDSWDGGSAGAFNLTLTKTGTCCGTTTGGPANDNCSNATDITGLFTSTVSVTTVYSLTTTGTNVNAGSDQASTACFNNSKNVWYKFTPAISGSYYVGVQGSSAVGTISYPEVAVFTGTCCSFTNIGCAGSKGGTAQPYGYFNSSSSPYYSYAGGCDLVAGTTYYVMVDNAGASSNAGTFTLTVANLSNDNPSNAAILSSCGVNFTSSTIGATNCDNCIGTWYNNLDCNNSTSVGSGSGSDVYSGMSVENDSWYVFCTTTAGTYTVTLSAVNSSCIGSNASSSSELQCNFYTGVGALSYTALGWQYGDYFGNAWSEVVPITLAANGCCYIEVDGYAGTNCNYSLVLSGACTLPIELLSFSGENIESRKNKLKWTTASETQTSFYYVERSSDAKKFIQIGKLKAAGTSTTPRNYEFYDEQPFSGDNYYRLITVDINGKEEIASSVVITNKIQHPVLTVYPNPAKNFLNVDLTNFSSPTINLDVVDMYGRTVWSSELSTVDGGLKTQIDLSGFGGGMYFVKVYDGNDFYKKRIFVSRD